MTAGESVSVASAQSQEESLRTCDWPGRGNHHRNPFGSGVVAAKLEAGLMTAGFWWKQVHSVHRGEEDMPQCSGKTPSCRKLLLCNSRATSLQRFLALTVRYLCNHVSVSDLITLGKHNRYHLSPSCAHCFTFTWREPVGSWWGIVVWD